MSEGKENKENKKAKKEENNENKQEDQKEVKKVTFGSIFAWLFGGLMLLGGISSLFTNFIAGVLALIIAVIVLPPFNKRILEEKFNMQLSTGLKIVIVIILLALIGAAIPSEELDNELVNNESPQAETNTDKETESESNGEKTTEEDKSIKEEDIVKASAKEILSTFEANEVRGNKLYKDKRIELTGVVSKISHSDFVEERYTLSIGTGEDFEFTTIDINADMSFEDELMELNEGDQITVLFDCEGLVANLYVEGDLVEIK